MNLSQKLNNLSMKSATLLGFDVEYFARAGFWTTLGQAVNAGLSFLLVIAFANLLPKETYGLYRYLLSLASILSVFTLTGMNTAVMQSVSSGNEGSLINSVKYQLKWGLLMLAASLVLAVYYFLQENFVLAISLIILGVFTPLTSALNTYGAYLNGKKEFKLNNLFSVYSGIIYSIGMAAVIFLNKNVIILILIYSLTTFIANLIFYLKTIRLFQLEEKASPEVLDYGRKLTFVKAIGVIGSQIDKIILAHFWGIEQLAIYTLATAIPERITPLIKNTVNLGMPKLVQRNEQELNKVFYKRIFLGLFFGLVAAAGYFLVVPVLFRYILPKYLQSLFYSQILGLGFIIFVPMIYIEAIFQSKKRVRSTFINITALNIFEIASYVVLGIWGGIWGLVLAQLLQYFVGLILDILLWRFNI